MRVLDVGCGPGRLTLEPAGRVSPGNVAGVDPARNSPLPAATAPGRRHTHWGGRRPALTAISTPPCPAWSSASCEIPAGEYGRWPGSLAPAAPSPPACGIPPVLPAFAAGLLTAAITAGLIGGALVVVAVWAQQAGASGRGPRVTGRSVRAGPWLGPGSPSSHRPGCRRYAGAAAAPRLPSGPGHQRWRETALGEGSSRVRIAPGDRESRPAQRRDAAEHDPPAGWGPKRHEAVADRLARRGQAWGRAQQQAEPLHGGWPVYPDVQFSLMAGRDIPMSRDRSSAAAQVGAELGLGAAAQRL